MVEIARDEKAQGIFQKDISISQNLSNKYLDQIIHALKISGLIANVKGKKSGYRLTRKPENITVLDIHKAFEPMICMAECLSEDFICERNNQCRTKDVWNGLNECIINYLKSVSLADILNREIFPDVIRSSEEKP
jgi:Rrf2 family protein